LIEQDPFVHVAFNQKPLPHENNYHYLAYVVTVIIGSPIITLLTGISISMISGEWWEHKTFRRELWIGFRAVFILSPFIGGVLKLLFEKRIGYMMYPDDTETDFYHTLFYKYIISPLGYMILTDFYFYVSHRAWHIPIIYEYSHRIHHSSRPSTTFVATAADAMEVFISGNISTFFPVFFIPIDARVYLIMIVFTQVWTCYLHNNKATRIPGGILNDSYGHNIHHYYGQVNYNFALFFKFWDKVFGSYRENTETSARFKRA